MGLQVGFTNLNICYYDDRVSGERAASTDFSKIR